MEMEFDFFMISPDAQPLGMSSEPETVNRYYGPQKDRERNICHSELDNLCYFGCGQVSQIYFGLKIKLGL